MGLFLIYGTVDVIVKAVHTDYLKYNVVSRDIDSKTFEESTDYYIYKSGFPQVYPQVENFGVVGVDYVEIEGNHEILESYEGLENVLLTDESGSVTYEIEVGEAGFYRILVTYFPYIGESDDAIKGKSSNIERRLYVNGEVPFSSADNVVFRRLWGPDGRITKDIHGNDIRPRQIELPEWTKEYVKDAVGYIVEPFEIYFDSGINTLKIESLREPMVLGKIELESINELKTYSEMEAFYQERGYQNASNSLEIYQAETPVNTTSPTLYPLNDRSSSLTMPNHPSKQILNSIGGNNWRLSGDVITWDFTVPEDGLYEITLRVKQKMASGMTVARNIYIDGEIPFKEMENYEFIQNSDWRLQTLGTTKEPYKFYLEAGEHTISMEVSLGKYGLLISEVNNAINNLSQIYREIIIYTGAEPDDFRDYGLTTRIPDLLERFETERTRLRDTRQALIDISGTKSEKTGIIDTVLILLDDFLKKPSGIHKKLKNFENNIASLGTLIILLDQQPLELDYFVVSSNSKLMRGRESAFESLWNGFRAFIASFIVDYSSVGMTSNEDVTTIDVWLSVGQDQANILRRLINETFTPEHGIQVNLKLVSGAALLPATLAGQGPDVALGVGSDVPVNYAMRDAVYDLTKFADFNDVITRFSESGLVPFNYLNSTYALPETEMFLVMFYRTDIFEELGFEVPQTWQDVNTLVPDLQNYNLDFYMPLPTSVGVMSLAPNPVFSTMFYQRDGDFYLGEGDEYGKESGFASGHGPEVFEQWTRFYTDYSFVLDANFANRFRSGQMPIGLAYYNTYNTLSVFAPEIRGKWDFALVPGTKEADGTIRRDTVSAVSGSMILKQSKHPEESWEFLKWWSSTETQVRFGREMEGILGAAARYPTANKDAIQQLPWTTKEYSILLEQWEWTKGIPNVPGSYMTGRHLDNAFRKVINDKDNPRETIYDYVQIINQELTKKRREFGLQ